MAGMEVYLPDLGEGRPGFEVYVAQLESIAKGKATAKPDQKQCFQLLQQVISTLEHTEKGVFKKYQRKCEDVVMELLFAGASPSVRRLIGSLICKMYTHGDSLPIYSRVGVIQGFLMSRGVLSGRDASELARCGALECLATLCQSHGMILSNTMEQSVIAATKHASAKELSVRCAALRLLAAAVMGAQGARNAEALQAEALKVVRYYFKDKSAEVRARVASVLAAIAAAGGEGLWAAGGAVVDEVIKVAVSGLEDLGVGVAQAYAEALGLIAAAAGNASAKAALEKRKGSKRTALERSLSSSFNSCLVVPLFENTVLGNTRVLGELAVAWLAYLRAVKEKPDSDDTALIDIAVLAISKLANVRIAEENLLASGAVLPKPGLGWGLSSGEMPALQACMIYVTRAGVIENLTETGLHSLLERLCTLLASVIANQTAVAVVTLEVLGLLLEVLGEVSQELHAKLEEPVRWKLLAGSSVVRMQAARLLAALSAAQPSSAASLLRTAAEDLRQATAQMASLAAPYGAKHYLPTSMPTTPATPQHAAGVQTAPGTPRGPNTKDIRPAIDAVHGRALGLAALLVATKQLPQGVPHGLPLEALTLADRLISSPMSNVPSARAVEREAGYILLGALSYSLPEEAICGNEERILELWSVALGSQAALQLDAKHFTGPKAAGEEAWAQEIWWRAAALQALQGFIIGPIQAAAPALRHRLTMGVAKLLHPTLTAIAACSALSDAKVPSSTLASAAATLRLRLLQAYCCIPDASSYHRDHKALVTLCARPLRGSTKTAAEGHLRRLLNAKGGALLGPWLARRNALEDELAAFTGAAGGPLIHAWEAGMGFHIDDGGEDRVNSLIGSTGASVLLYAFPQAVSLDTALLETEVVLLGRLLSVAVEAQQLAVLDMMRASVKGEVGRRREKDRARRAAMIDNVCGAAIEGLRRAANRASQSRSGDSEKLVEAAVQLGYQVVAEADGDSSLLRAAADIFSTAAALGSDGLAKSLLKVLCKEVQEPRSPDHQRFAVLAIGGVHSAKGGMALRSLVPLSADTLLWAVRSLAPDYHTWALHSLRMLADSSGLAFMQHVKPSLEALRDLLAMEVTVMPGLLPLVGQVVNSMVVVLGPELEPGSSIYQTCLSLLLEMDDAAGSFAHNGQYASSWEQSLSGMMPPEEAVAALLETVHFSQQLVLFAPHAVPAAKHVPMLRSRITSPQPALREAAARSLRHLAERDPCTLLPTGVQRDLFLAIDSETDAMTLRQLQATMHTLLGEGGPRSPLEWLNLLADVALAAGGKPKGIMAEQSDAEADVTLGDGSDEETEAPGPPSDVPGSSSAGISAPGGQLRLRTRVFAGNLLLELLELCARDNPAHFEVASIQGGKQGNGGRSNEQWLIQQLQGQVDLGYKLASGQVEVLRGLGMRILVDVVQRFGAAEDPHVEGHKLLELYQAQLVSAIRLALAPEAAPGLQTTGCTLVACFLEAGLDGGDPVVVRRMMNLLLRPLQDWEKTQGKGSMDEQYAEWVGMSLRVAILKAHARCSTIVCSNTESRTAKMMWEAQLPQVGKLQTLWADLLQDHMVLSSLPVAALTTYTPSLFASTSPPVVSAVKPPLQAAWPVVMSGLGASIVLRNTDGSPLEGVMQKRVVSACLFALQEVAVIEPAGGRVLGPGAREKRSSLCAVDSKNGGVAEGQLKDVLTCLQRALSVPSADESRLGKEDVLRVARVVLHLSGVVLKAMLAQRIDSVDIAGIQLQREASTGVLGVCPWAFGCCADILRSLMRFMPVPITEAADVQQVVMEASMLLACLSIPIRRSVKGGGETGVTAIDLPAGVSDGETAQMAAALDTALTAAQELLTRAPATDHESTKSDEAHGSGDALLQACLDLSLELFMALPEGSARQRLQKHIQACIGIGLNGDSTQQCAAASCLAKLCSAATAAVDAAASVAHPNVAPALLLLLSAASVEDPQIGEGGRVAMQQRSTLLLLRRALVEQGSPDWLQLAAVQSLQLIQQAAADAEPGTAACKWAVSCFLHLGGGAVGDVLQKLQPTPADAPDEADGDWGFQSADSSDPQLSDTEVAMAGATIKSVMLGLRVAEGIDATEPAGQDGTLSSAMMSLLVPLLLACAAPDEGAPSAPALRSMALRLITHLAQGQGHATGAFKECIAALPPAGKRRLQTALVQSSGPQGRGAAAAQPATGLAPPAAAPKIQFNLSKFKK